MTTITSSGFGPIPTDAFYRELIDGLNDGVYFVDLERRITYWNQAAERITGYAKEEVVGRFCHENLLRHVDGEGHELCGDGCPLAATCVDGKARQAPVFLHHREGHRVPVLVKAAPIRDIEGAIRGAVEVFTDESTRVESIRRVEELEQIAFLDALTGVGNRRFCEHVLDQRLAELRRHGWPFGFLFLDVDHFKSVNDVHGHDVGDAVLQTVAKTLMHAVRAGDFVGRWGGEEFVIIAVRAEIEGVRTAAERLRMAVAASEAAAATGPVRVTVSMGAAMARPEDDVTSLVKRADSLMYQSKESGRNRVTVEGSPISAATWFRRGPSPGAEGSPFPLGTARTVAVPLSGALRR